MKTKLKQLKNKIYCLKHSTDSIEEAMEKELVFGGKIMHGKEIFTIVGKGRDKKGTYYTTIREGKYDGLYESRINECVKILGTNISLADVLMALDKVMLPIDNEISSNDYVNFRLYILSAWNMYKDYLDWHAENKPEVIEFLHYIICK